MKRLTISLAALLAVSCSGAPATVHLALPEFRVEGGKVFEPVPVGDEQAIPRREITRFEVSVLRDGRRGRPIDLLPAVRRCGSPCELPLVVRPGYGLVFDFRAYRGEDELLRRGFAVTDVEEDIESTITVVMWPASRFVTDATADTGEAPIRAEYLDVVRQSTAMLLVAGFDRPPVDATNDRLIRAIGGKIEFDFSALGAGPLGGVPLDDGFLVTHRLQLAPSCDRFLFMPSAVEVNGAGGCGQVQVPGAGVPVALPYQIYGRELVMRIPYRVIAGDNFVRDDLFSGRFVAGFQPVVTGGWQKIRGSIRP